MNKPLYVTGIVLALLAGAGARADVIATEVNAALEARFEHYSGVATELWELAEVGYQEQRSSALLRKELRRAGFTIESGVADIPTAFVASFGKGEPVIAVLAEYDALPGLSQTASTQRQARVEEGAGHACGHHLFGTASLAAAVTMSRWLKDNKQAGTVRLYGTPAEEGGSGKVYMVRAGLFDDVDTALHWHPADSNGAASLTTLANKSARFKYYGTASHAAAAPERGRSALDGVEAMNMMVNMLREHVPDSTRIHYVITAGGTAPNIVPEFAEVYYYVRSPSAEMLQPIWHRIEQAAEGAAQGTGTRMEREVIHGNHSTLPNVSLSGVMDASLRQFGGIHYTEEETEFARQLAATLPPGGQFALGSEAEIQPFSEEITAQMGSTDVGDVSWTVPTVGLLTATWVPGTSPHSWQAVAAGGHSIGMKGMLLAAKSMALTGIELLRRPELREAARQEFLQRRGADFKYEAVLGDRAPPLDYRR